MDAIGGGAGIVLLLPDGPAKRDEVAGKSKVYAFFPDFLARFAPAEDDGSCAWAGENKEEEEEENEDAVVDGRGLLAFE